ncbi:uncharacterized protein EV422DRAFT_67086 [Fimicolochytrium jonesii]|uniref:uncharacterized protein n=1 Tax=Fimicolochytrium jonesii TaxID=1396493 RepID=UPI0022FDC8CA|nr:uncharacterized protein EV422DRAFT_67086 [Fimicolochytrium jonesii]KAI8820883.1 hypothetical protein EV422DRAFT_67086 [Fimicolochytrium jonesii]
MLGGDKHCYDDGADEHDTASEDEVSEAKISFPLGYIGIYMEISQSGNRDVLHASAAINLQEDFCAGIRCLRDVYHTPEHKVNVRNFLRNLGRESTKKAFEDYLKTLKIRKAVADVVLEDFCEVSADERQRRNKRRRLQGNEARPERDGVPGLEAVPDDEAVDASFIDGVPGLEAVFKGKDEAMDDDLVLEEVNISQLYRRLMRDIVLDQQRPAMRRSFRPNDALMAVALKRGLLVSRHLPTAYERYITREQWEEVYQHLAGADAFWHKGVTVPPSSALVSALQDIELSILDQDCGFFTFDDKSGLQALDYEEQHMIRSIFPHLSMDPPTPQSEPSYTAKYIVPHFNRLKQPRWDIRFDSTMVDRQRPDIAITALGRPILLGELKTPHAQPGKRDLQLADGLCRALTHLKDDAKEFDWNGTLPTLYTMISPDGLYFQLFKVILHSNLTFYVSLGKIPVVTSAENLWFLSRCF